MNIVVHADNHVPLSKTINIIWVKSDDVQEVVKTVSKWYEIKKENQTSCFKHFLNKKKYLFECIIPQVITIENDNLNHVYKVQDVDKSLYGLMNLKQ